jgi:hypothetical protein
MVGRRRHGASGGKGVNMENEVTRSSNNKPDHDQSASLEHMAVSMFAKRVQEDTKRGLTTIYRNNPSARAIYFKGVHDTITCIETWSQMGLDTNTFAAMLQALHDQTMEADQTAQ